MLVLKISVYHMMNFRYISQSAQIALSALIYAMEETGKVALVRRVYNVNSPVKLGVLSPRIKLKYEVYFIETVILKII